MGAPPWLIKFRGADDDADAPRVELAYMELARSAGLRVSATRGEGMSLRRTRVDLTGMTRSPTIDGELSYADLGEQVAEPL